MIATGEHFVFGSPGNNNTGRNQGKIYIHFFFQGFKGNHQEPNI